MKWASILLAIIFALAAAFQAAHVTWLGLAPKENGLGSGLPTPAASVSRDIELGQSHLFGVPPKPMAEVRTPSAPPVRGRLLGVYAGETGYAIVEMNGETVITHVGEALAKGIRVVAVEPDGLVYDRNGQEGRWDFAEAQVDGSSVSDVNKVGRNRFQVDRSLVTDSLHNPTRWMRAGRVMVDRNGGLRVTRVKPGDMYEQLGLKVGDVIQSVNGSRIGDPTELLAMLPKLKTARSVQIQVMRRGRSETLHYSLQ